MRRLAVLLALPCVVAACSSGPRRGAIRVTLTAQNHDPRASRSPSVQWGYCVRVGTSTGAPVASRIRLRIVRGHTPVREMATVRLNKGYDHWCGSIGGEASVLNVVPRRTTLAFQAVVTANGTTVTREWPIVVR